MPNGLPPKPPRLPPGFARRALLILVLQLLPVLLNGWLAHNNAKIGSDIGLFVNSGGLALSGWAFVIVLRRLREDLRDWADLRRQWDALNEHYNGKGPQ